MAYDLHAVAQEVLRYCREHDVPPMKAKRSDWLDWPARTHTKEAVNALGWNEVKREAARNWAPHDVLPEGHRVRGVSTLVSKDGEKQAQWVKTTEEKLTRDQILEKLLEDIPGKVPSRDVTSPPAPEGLDDQLLSAYIMGDPHLGMLAWHQETLDRDFDLPTAERTLTEAMRYLVAQGRPAKRAVLVNVGDFYHADNMEGVTSRSGHQLDTDTRWSKVLRVGLRCMINLVELALAKHETVEVVNEIGNHDDHSAFFLSVAMDAYFTHEPRVTVDLSPARFHYLRHGKCLVGITHGDAQGAKRAEDLESIMACDRPRDWGETMHRYWWTGHIHHKSAKDTRGSSAEAFRTLAPTDAWSAGQGYRGRSEMTRITLHSDYGEVARSVVNSTMLHAMLEGAA